MYAKAAPRRNPREILDEVLGKRAYLDLTDAVYINPVVAACGGYGDVFEGLWLKDGSSEPCKVAVKRIRIHLGEAKFTRHLAREVYVWSGLDHPNILPFCGYMLEGNFPSLVSEWMENGTVRRYLEGRPDIDLLPLVIGIAEGLEYLHGQHIIHSDLKADNVLISIDGKPQICDFGISGILASSQTFGGISAGQSGTKGSLRWMAKELFETCEPPNTHSMESDIWAFGMTVYELLTKEFPFFHLKIDAQVILHISLGNQPLRPASIETWPDRYQKLWALCQTCWDIPGRRCRIDYIVSTLNGLQREEHSEYSGYSVLSDQHILAIPYSNANDTSPHAAVVDRLHHMHLSVDQPLDKTLNASRGNENLGAMHSGSQSVDSSQSTESDGADPAWAGPTENTRHKLKHRDAVDTVTLSELGSQEQALQIKQRSLARTEALAKKDPDRFNPRLANALHFLAADLANLGRYEEALEADQRAVSIREVLAERDPDRFNPALASSLQSLGIDLSKLKKDALEANQRAVSIRETLAEKDPDKFNPLLAKSLHAMGVALSKLGISGEALEAYKRSALIREALAEKDPDSFNPELADSFYNMGIDLSKLGRQGEALEACQKAISIREVLAEKDPDRFNPPLGSSRREMSRILARLKT